jgi:glycosyltransferase involved in cell wall biosynthesis
MPSLTPLPPIATQPLSVVLLAHNAVSQVAAVVSRWVTFLDGLKRDYELILVDDGSTDGTAEKAESLAEKYPALRVLRHATHQGEGAALRTALEATRHPLLFYTLCDPAYRPADLGRMLAKTTADPAGGLEIDHVHLMSGYRAGCPVPGVLRILGRCWRLLSLVLFSYAPRPLPGWLGWRGHLGRLLVRILFGVRYQDVACPFRLIRRDIFARFPIQSRGPFVHVEILAKANFLTLVMGEELPIDVRPQSVDRKAMFREGRQVFAHPDFGPPPVKTTSAAESDRQPVAQGEGPRGNSL